jgi:hypothetical protein
LPSPPIYQTRNDEGTVRAALDQAFGEKSKPTALLCMSDKIALHAIDWLTAHNLCVPEDVSVIGFDDIPAAADARPPLTTIAQPIEEIGQFAVQAILSPDYEIRRKKVPVTLVRRASTGPAPARKWRLAESSIDRKNRVHKCDAAHDADRQDLRALACSAPLSPGRPLARLDRRNAHAPSSPTLATE